MKQSIWRKIRKTLLISSVFLSVSGCALLGVKSDDRLKDIKIYVLDSKFGLIRTQEKEVLSFTRAEGFFCASPNTWQYILNRSIDE